jgi:hypothetical protein
LQLLGAGFGDAITRAACGCNSIDAQLVTNVAEANIMLIFLIIKNPSRLCDGSLNAHYIFL